MHTLKFECEVVTPMFLAGADGITPELRAPSIKGAMRFWWRAVNGHLSIDKLREKEAEIFGGSGEKEGKSKVSIRVEHKNINVFNYRVLPHSDTKRFMRLAIRPSFKFNVLFQLQETEFITSEQFKNLFLLVSILGGLGKRARRGFGVFKVNKINEIDFSNNEINLGYIKNLLNSVNVDEAKHFQINDDNEDNEIVSDFNFNHFPYIKKIKIGKNGNEYNNLLTKIGESSHNNNSDFTGFAKSNNRLSSPVYVSVLSKNNECYPIVTILKTISNLLDGTDRSEQFIEGVLS